jgi:hypothetical protein
MIRGILAFVAVWAIVFMGISFFWHSSSTEKLNMFRNAVYSAVTAIIAFVILFFIVVLFYFVKYFLLCVIPFDPGIDLEMTRLLCLKAAHMMDTVGNKASAAEIAMIKVQAPNMALKIIDDAIQAHGGGGVSEDYGLASAWAHQRTLRLADGPDEVHNRAIARLELGKHGDTRPRDLSSGDMAATR